MDWMIHNGKRVLRIIGGFLLIIFGIICGFIPILQGWIFILAGLALLSVDFEWARRLRDRLKSGAKTVWHKVRRPRET